MHIAEVVTIAKSLPLLRLNTYKSLILSYSADYRRILSKKPNIIGTLAGFYQSRAIQGVYNLSPICNVSTSLQWASPDGKTKVILKGNDILNTSNMTTRLAWGQQRNRTEMNWDNRSFTFSFLYKFGGYKEKKRTDVDTKRLGR